MCVWGGKVGRVQVFYALSDLTVSWCNTAVLSPVHRQGNAQEPSIVM